MAQAIDFRENSDATGASDEPESGFPVPEDEAARKARGERLRHAVREAGGATSVSQKSGVALSTLHAYQSGQEMKLSQVVCLAAATGVSLEWLATGRSPALSAPDSASNRGFAEAPLPAPSAVGTKWPALSPEDAKAINAALSLAQTSVYNGGQPVDGALLIAALDEFFTPCRADNAAEIGRISLKYRRMSENLYAEREAVKSAAALDLSKKDT